MGRAIVFVLNVEDGDVPETTKPGFGNGSPEVCRVCGYGGMGSGHAKCLLKKEES